MTNRYRNWRWGEKGLLFLALYTFYPLFFFPQYYFSSYNQPVFFRLFFQSYLLLFFTPFMLWLGRRFSIEPPFRLLDIIVISLSPFFIAAAHVALFMFLWQVPLAGWGLVTPVNPNIFLYEFSRTSVFCAAILAFHQAINYFRKYRDHEFRLQEAELLMFRSQLDPHFLFNSLNAISSLINISPTRAHATLSQLGDLLRASFTSGKTHEISLQKELDLLTKYVHIHKTLMGKRLDFICNVEPETMNAAVPNMILQPIVENAIRHGIAPLENGGRIELNVTRRRGQLLLQITDNGAGLRDHRIVTKSSGIGLVNTKTRLLRLYGNSCEFDISEPAGGGVMVDLVIPYRKLALESVETLSEQQRRPD